MMQILPVNLSSHFATFQGFLLGQIKNLCFLVIETNSKSVLFFVLKPKHNKEFSFI